MTQKKYSQRKRRVFCSYSSADRLRIGGLGLLIQALDYEVFIDHKTILPGARWEASLQDGLDNADMLVVYWSKHAAKSDWVRDEIEYFHSQYPDRPIIPIVGDETPMSRLLNAFQKSDLFPFINELIGLRDQMERDGKKPKEIQQAVLERLDDAGIHIEHQNRRRLLGLFVGTGVMGMIFTPAASLYSTYNRAVQAAAQLTASEALVLALAASVGAGVCSMAGIHTPVAIEHQSQTNPSGFGALSDQNLATFPGDFWLGTWEGTISYSDGVTSELKIDVMRECKIYVIKTGSPNPIRDFSSGEGISAYGLTFSEQNGIQVRLYRHTTTDEVSGNINFTDDIVRVTGLRADIAVMTKTRKSDAEPCS